jgi:hypothetical protein
MYPLPVGLQPVQRLLLIPPLVRPVLLDGKLLGQVLRIFIDSVAFNYRKRVAHGVFHAERRRSLA